MSETTPEQTPDSAPEDTAAAEDVQPEAPAANATPRRKASRRSRR